MELNDVELNLANEFASDRLSSAIGLANELPDELASKSKGLVRVSLAINTHYPEIFGGYYLNARVVELVDDALLQLSISIANPEYISPGRICPVERILAVSKDELCMLLQKNGLTGWLMKWQFDAGGGGDFFSDNLIIDLLLPKAQVSSFVHRLTDLCGSAGVKFFQT